MIFFKATDTVLPRGPLFQGELYVLKELEPWEINELIVPRKMDLFVFLHHRTLHCQIV
jgi:hypothetical protein